MAAAGPPRIIFSYGFPMVLVGGAMQLLGKQIISCGFPMVSVNGAMQLLFRSSSMVSVGVAIQLLEK